MKLNHLPYYAHFALCVSVIAILLWRIRQMKPVEKIVHDVLIQKLSFIRNKEKIESMSVKKGEYVKFQNKDTIRNAIVCEQSVIRNSDLLLTDEYYEVLFPQRGTYTFASSLYGSMKPLKVIVT